MVYLVYLLALIFIVLGFLFGVSVGWKCVHGRNAVGNLMIAPGDENEQPYIFLDLTTSVEYLESSEYVVLKVKPLETREKQSVNGGNSEFTDKGEDQNGKQNIIERDFGKWDGIAENDEARF